MASRKQRPTASAVQAPAVPPRASARATVNVMCKLPHGLVLRLWDMVDEGEPQRDGTVRNVQRARQRISAGEVTLNGYLKKYDPSQPPLSQGSHYAITPGVPKDFFDEWMEQNADADVVKNHLIFAAPSADRAEDEAREFSGTRCGLEPIDPSNLPKAFSKISTFSKEA